MNRGTSDLAKRLRREMTPPEVLLWVRIRRNDLHIRRQHPLDRYVTDFYCAAARMVIEVDGEIHELRGERDAMRDQRLWKREIRTWRIPAKAILDDPDAVATLVLMRLRARISGEEPMP